MADTNRASSKHVDKDTKKYLDAHGFPFEMIASRFRALSMEVLFSIKNLGIPRDAIWVCEELLFLAVLDYFVDTARLKDAQMIEKTNVQKIYSRSAYWFLRRKPVQFQLPPPENFVHINEKITLFMMLPKMLEERGIKMPQEGWSEKTLEMFESFSNLLFYNLKHRIYTPESLELAIEAFFCGTAFN